MLVLILPGNAIAATNSVSADYSKGSVVVGSNANTCNTGLYGAVRFTSTTGIVDFCNGTNWVATVLSNDTNLTNCVAANRGALRYNSAGTRTMSAGPIYSNYIQVCDGTNWAYVGGTAASAAGANTQVQYNSGGTQTGSANLTWANVAGNLNVSNMYAVAGTQGLKLTTSGNPIIGNTGTGWQALAPNSIGIGYLTLDAANTELNSVSVGHEALRYTSSTTNNIAIGSYAMNEFKYGGNSRTAIGQEALRYYTNGGAETTALGVGAVQGGFSTRTTALGINNTCAGPSCGWILSTGQDNTGYGRRGMYGLTTGSYNTGSVQSSGGATSNMTDFTVPGNHSVAGDNNTLFGNAAGGTLTTGTNNILIGNSAPTVTTTTSNHINIGTLIYGSSNTGAVAIGTASFSPPFMVAPAAVQTIAAGNTIAANSCGSIKTITSTANRTTNTTNTFTAPAADLVGCCMNVVNVGAFTITLDSNANFPGTGGGANVVLTANGGSIMICLRPDASLAFGNWGLVSGRSTSN